MASIRIMNRTQQKRDDLRSLSQLLDTKFKGPFGIRYGLDGLLGLIPGIGDFITASMSFYIIFQAARLGVSTPILVRMILNVLLENLVDTIPVLGNLFDFFWKSNSKNINLIERHFENSTEVTLRSKAVLFSLLMLIVFLMGVVFYGTYLVFKLMLQALL